MTVPSGPAAGLVALGWDGVDGPRYTWSAW